MADKHDDHFVVQNPYGVAGATAPDRDEGR